MARPPRPLLAAWLSLVLLLGPPPLAAGANPDPVVVSAYADAAGLYFEAPVPLPWERWLPSDLQPASLASDAARRRELFAQRSDFGFSEVAFFRPMPPDLQGRFYYLLDPSGVRPIRPTGLRGTARIEWSDSGEVRAVHAFGYVLAADPGAGPGGFVLVSEQPRRLRVIPSRRTADALLAPTGGTYVGRGTAFREIVAQYEAVEDRPRRGGVAVRAVEARRGPDGGRLPAPVHAVSDPAGPRASGHDQRPLRRLRAGCSPQRARWNFWRTAIRRKWSQETVGLVLAEPAHQVIRVPRAAVSQADRLEFVLGVGRRDRNAAASGQDDHGDSDKGCSVPHRRLIEPDGRAHRSGGVRSSAMLFI